MRLSINSRPFLRGTLTIWSLGPKWGFSFSETDDHEESFYQTLVQEGFKASNRAIMTSLSLRADAKEFLSTVIPSSKEFPPVLSSGAMLLKVTPHAPLNTSELNTLENLVAPHLDSIEARATLGEESFTGPLTLLSEDDAHWVERTGASLAFSDASLLWQSDGAPMPWGTWAFYSTSTGLHRGQLNMEDPSSSKVEMFAAEQALLAHEGNVLLMPDDYSVVLAATGKTNASPLLHQAYLSGRLRVTHVKGHADCIGNIMVDSACRSLSKSIRRAEITNKQQKVTARGAERKRRKALAVRA